MFASRIVTLQNSPNARSSRASSAYSKILVSPNMRYGEEPSNIRYAEDRPVSMDRPISLVSNMPYLDVASEIPDDLNARIDTLSRESLN